MLMRHKLVYLILFLLCFCVLDSFSQLQVVSNNNATQLAQILQGSGVLITNATINCPVGASGTFDGTASDINIAGGVLLTTGQVGLAVGPNNNDKEGKNNAVLFSDPELIAIEPLAIFDPCILEFDATPSCDTLAFTFSFGSEEYLEYVSAGYNDVFGIFVSGANPAGAQYNNKNVALIPSTNIPVSIDNVNKTNNPFYYVDNIGGDFVQYDGFTKPIDVALRVVPCTPYHFKLAIADAGDGAYDSGVFFSLQSLKCSSGLSITTSSTPSLCEDSTGTLTVTNIIGGSAPYSYSWNTVPVQTTATATGLAPGIYMLTVVDAAGCLSGTVRVAVNASGGGFPVTLSQTDVSCYGLNNGTAAISPAGGILPYTYLWNTNPVKTTASVSALPAGTYTCLAKDAVGCTQTATVTITQPAVLAATISNVVNVSCKGGKNGSATASAAGGTPGYMYAWNTSPAQSSAVASNLSAGNYIVIVTDAQGCTFTQSVTITESTAITLNTTSTPASCATKDGTATVSASSGTPPYTYLWLTSPIQSTPTATGLGDGVYTIIVTDANGCTEQKTSTITGGAPPVADFIYNPDTISILDPSVNFFNQSIGNYSSSFWIFGDTASGVNDSSSLQHPLHLFSDTGTYCITLIVADHTGNCKDTSIKCIKVNSPFTFYIPNAFTPNGNHRNELFLGYGTNIKEFHIMIFDRWGNKVFETNDIREGWNGKMNGSDKQTQQDAYVWKVKIIDILGGEHNYIGHVDKLH